ncbi:putative nuclease HARBI1 isoform X1 [Ixodes scapularis]
MECVEDEPEGNIRDVGQWKRMFGALFSVTAQRLSDKRQLDLDADAQPRISSDIDQQAAGQCLHHSHSHDRQPTRDQSTTVDFPEEQTVVRRHLAPFGRVLLQESLSRLSCHLQIPGGVVQAVSGTPRCIRAPGGDLSEAIPPAQDRGAVVVRRTSRGTGGEESAYHVMTVELQVLCALRFYGTGSFQGMVASDEHVAREQKTVSVTVRAVSVAIVRRLGVQRGWIHFPETPSERFDAEKGFRLLGRIPGVIGCVDGTMVSIVGPSKNDPTVTKAAYWCRKYFYALNVMVTSVDSQATSAASSGNLKEAFEVFGPCIQGLEDMDTIRKGSAAGPKPAATTADKDCQISQALPTVDHPIIRTDSEEVAKSIQEIREVVIEQQNIPVQVFRAYGVAYCKGVIYDIHTLKEDPQDEVLNLELDSEKIPVVAARRLGKTTTAMLTFDSDRIPRSVLYGRRYMRVYSYKPKAVTCTNCHRLGHKPDICPNASGLIVRRGNNSSGRGGG